MGALFFHFLSFLMNALKTFFNTGKWSKSSKWWILGIYDLDNAPSTKTYRTWVIVVLSFFLHSVSVGNIYAVGIFIPPLEDEFCGLEKVGGNFTDNSTFYSATIPISTPLARSCRGPISWIPTLGNSMLLAFSAPGGRFIDKWGFRIPTIVGGVLMAVSLFAASFASEIWHLYLSAGVLFGNGNSCCWIRGWKFGSSNFISIFNERYWLERGNASGCPYMFNYYSYFFIIFISTYTYGKKLGRIQRFENKA